MAASAAGLARLLSVEDKPPAPEETPPDRQPERPPGDFTSEELEADTARFLEELRRRAAQQRRIPRRRSGPPPPAKPSS